MYHVDEFFQLLLFRFSEWSWDFVLPAHIDTVSVKCTRVDAQGFAVDGEGCGHRCGGVMLKNEYGYALRNMLLIDVLQIVNKSWAMLMSSTEFAHNP